MTQDLFVARSFPPTGAPEAEEVDESGDEGSVEGDARDDETLVAQNDPNLDASSDVESSPANDHTDRADDLAIPDAALSTEAPSSQKRSLGGFVNEDSLFGE